VIYGIGTDIVQLDRIERLHDQHGERFAKRILGASELAEYRRRAERALAHGHKAATRYLAKRFAAKEAFSKALGTGLRAPMTLLSVEVLNDARGRPYAITHSDLLVFMQQEGLNAHVSISDEVQHIVAFVILEKR
jgi:holo-[acyl-carrier protein] synthase